MKSQTMTQLCGTLAATMMLVICTITGSEELPAKATVPVSMTVTANVAANKRAPEISPDDIVVKQGKSRLQVTEWVPARGDRAGLELFILIDDTADSRISLQYEHLRAFINAQPASTLVGVGYMRRKVRKLISLRSSSEPNSFALPCTRLRSPPALRGMGPLMSSSCGSRRQLPCRRFSPRRLALY